MMGERRTGRLTKYWTNGSCMYPSCTADLAWLMSTCPRGVCAIVKSFSSYNRLTVASSLVPRITSSWELSENIQSRSELADTALWNPKWGTTEECPDVSTAAPPTCHLTSDPERSPQPTKLYIKTYLLFLPLSIFFKKILSLPYIFLVMDDTIFTASSTRRCKNTRDFADDHTARRGKLVDHIKMVRSVGGDGGGKSYVATC